MYWLSNCVNCVELRMCNFSPHTILLHYVNCITIHPEEYVQKKTDLAINTKQCSRIPYSIRSEKSKIVQNSFFFLVNLTIEKENSFFSFEKMILNSSFTHFHLKCFELMMTMVLKK